MTINQETIAANLRAERARLHLSIRELSEKTGISSSTIANYENGVCGISLENAWKLADVFNMPIGQLCGRDERKYEEGIPCTSIR